MESSAASLTEPSPVRIVLADDEELFRDALTHLIDSQPDLTVVGTASDGQDAVRQTERLSPDVALLDVRMPVLDGVAATLAIKALPQPPRVLVLTTFNSDEYVFQAFRNGADGFLLKRARTHQLHDAIRTVARGDAIVDPQATRSLISHCVRGGQPALDLSQGFGMTEREIDVLAEVATGHPNLEIAERLGISEQTVKSHIVNIYEKIGCSNRVQATIFAYDTGLVAPNTGRHTGHRDPGARRSRR